MITKLKCETCDGTGLVKVLMNADGYYVYADEPIIETLGCQDCGGSGNEREWFKENIQKAKRTD